MSTNNDDPISLITPEKVDAGEVRISGERGREIDRHKADDAMAYVIRVQRVMGWGATVLLLPFGLLGVWALIDACIRRSPEQPGVGQVALAIGGFVLCLIPLSSHVAAKRLANRDRRGLGMATLAMCLPWVGFLLTAPGAFFAARVGDFRLVPIPLLMLLLIILGMKSRDRLSRHERAYFDEGTYRPALLDRFGGWSVWVCLGAILLLVAAACAVPAVGVQSNHILYFRVGLAAALVTGVASAVLAVISLVALLKGRAKSWFGVSVLALLLNPMSVLAASGMCFDGSPTALFAVAFGWDADRTLAIFKPYPETFGEGPQREELAVDIGQGVVMKFRLIPAGSFRMGCIESEAAVLAAFPKFRKGITGYERPVREVEISQSYYIGTFEVTQRQWVAVMGKLPDFRRLDIDPEKPIVGISWEDCQRFLDVLNTRLFDGNVLSALPTEAQWEYAYRAGTTGRYYWGDSPDKLYDYASRGVCRRVGGRAPNAWGLHDMNGNAAEYCADYFEVYSDGACSDPTGPPTGEKVALRGGSFRAEPFGMRASYRWSTSPDKPTDSVGFRIVLRLPHQL